MPKMPQPADAVQLDEARVAEKALPLTYRDPVGATAVRRADRTDPHRLGARRDQLERRLQTAVARDDGAGLRLLTARLRRAVE